MKVFFEGKLTDRRIPRHGGKEPSDKDADRTDLHMESPEEFKETRALIHDLDKQFNELRETLQHRRARIVQLKRVLSGLCTLLLSARRRWWRRWLFW